MSESESLVADYLRRGGTIKSCPTVNTKEELRLYQWSGLDCASSPVVDNDWFEWLAAELEDVYQNV